MAGLSSGRRHGRLRSRDGRRGLRRLAGRNSGARWFTGADAPADGAARFDVLPEASPAVGAVPIALRVSGIAEAAGADASGA